MSSKNKHTSTVATALDLSVVDKLVFYGTVTITGASVMMVELLGTRVIGPFYGVSLIVWSSLLAVTLLALAFGYHVGGKLADRGDRLRLPHALFLAAVLVGVIPVSSEPVQLAFDQFGLRWGALSSAFVLFTPSLFFLGMAGPYVIRMATQGIESVGSTAGSVYAISTFGSVAGTLILGFYLLPVFGTYAILYALSIILVLLSAALAQYENTRLHKHHPVLWWVAATALLLVFVVWQMTTKREINGDYSVIFEEETHYGWVRVVDQPQKNLRWLMSDASTIGVEDLGTGAGLLAYQRVVETLPWFKPEAKDVLLIGLGSGHMVNEFAAYGMRTDSIEIDPAVAHAAQEYFSYQPTGELWVGDARYQIKRIAKKYDLIIHDCFTGGAEPFHLLSEEMIAEVKALLKPDGVLAVNFVGFTDPQKMKPVQSIARTLDTHFAQRRVFLSMPGESFNDYIFMVSDKPFNIDEQEESAPVRAWLAEREISVDPEGGELITDDYNPLEFLQIAKAEYYRDILVDRVGKSILFR